jgi:hypothetical protein
VYVCALLGWQGANKKTSMGNLIDRIREKIPYKHWVPVIAYSMETIAKRNAVCGIFCLDSSGRN